MTSTPGAVVVRASGRAEMRMYSLVHVCGAAVVAAVPVFVIN
jgi:hypothetical protein